MSKYDLSSTEGCAVIIVCIMILGIIYFGMPYVCMLGWAPIAAAFNLPIFAYWDWFWMSLLIRWLFKGSSGASVSRSR